jgi:DNA (cytosine-5)-methyltransferase 1
MPRWRAMRCSDEPRTTVKHLDLFSGIGGFTIAAQRVGWESIGFCEIDPFCLGVLERRFTRDRWFSLPGPVDRGAPSGARGAAELAWLAPDWLVIENVYHTWRRWMPELRRRLYALGYASLPLRVRAADVGAVHLRARGWLVAHTHSEPLRELSRWWSREGGQVATELARAWDSAPRGLGTNDGLPDPVDESRRRALGNAIVPACAELIYRGIKAVTSSGDSNAQK